MTKEILKKYFSVILMLLVLIPIYHIPIFLLTLMILTGILQQLQYKIIIQGIIILIGIIIEIGVHSLPSIFLYNILGRKSKGKENKEKLIISESIIIVLVFLSYIILFTIPLIASVLN